MSVSEKVIEQTEKFGANNYHRLPIVISEAQGVWVKDPEGNEYLAYAFRLFRHEPGAPSPENHSSVEGPSR